MACICCGATEAKLYPSGYRCAKHTPAAIAGRPEPPDMSTVPPRWIRPDGTVVPPPPLSTSWVHDRRAVESGRRVSGARRRAARGEAS
jgi:hypothetical protein